MSFWDANGKTDDEILAALMRRILARGVSLTQYNDRGPTITLDDRPYPIASLDEIEAIRRVVEASKPTA